MEREYTTGQSLKMLGKYYKGFVEKTPQIKPSFKEVLFARGDKQYVRREAELLVKTLQEEPLNLSIVALEPITDTSAVKLMIEGKQIDIGVNTLGQPISNLTRNQFEVLTEILLSFTSDGNAFDKDRLEAFAI